MVIIFPYFHISSYLRKVNESFRNMSIKSHGYFRLYDSTKFFLRSVVRSNAVHYSCLEKLQMSIPKNFSCPPHHCKLSRTLTIQETLKTELALQTPSFQADGANRQYLLSSTPSNVPDESTCRFRDFLLHIQNMLKKPVYIFPYKVVKVYRLQLENYAQKSGFSQSCIDHL